MNEMEQGVENSANTVDYTNDMGDFGVADDSDICFDNSIGMDESNTDDNGLSL